MLYKTCKNCGANLDPQEKCECETEKSIEVQKSKRRDDHE